MGLVVRHGEDEVLAARSGSARSSVSPSRAFSLARTLRYPASPPGGPFPAAAAQEKRLRGISRPWPIKSNVMVY